jgi:hypothetical protein
MLAESQSERHRQRLFAAQLIRAGNEIPLRKVLSLGEYPPSQSQLRAFYAESLTLTEFLIEEAGRKRFLKFVRQGERDGWNRAISEHYRFDDVEALESAWAAWVKRSVEKTKSPSEFQIAGP